MWRRGIPTPAQIEDLERQAAAREAAAREALAREAAAREAIARATEARDAAMREALKIQQREREAAAMAAASLEAARLTTRRLREEARREEEARARAAAQAAVEAEELAARGAVLSLEDVPYDRDLKWYNKAADEVSSRCIFASQLKTLISTHCALITHRLIFFLLKNLFFDPSKK